MNKIKNIIFDFGGVLIDWNPAYLYRKEFDNESEMNYFLENICTPEWNIQQDAGRPLAEATKLLQQEHPGYKELIGLYYGRWEEMLGGLYEDNIQLLHQLKENYSLYGLTNWSAETIKIAYSKYDFFNHLKGIVVSGDEKLIKPDPKIYQVILDRYNLKAKESVFIDDNIENVKAAQKMGFETIHFNEDTDLRKEAINKGLL